MLHLRKSIASIVIVALVAVTTLVLVAFGVVNYRSSQAQQLETLRQEQSNLADQLAVALALPVWNFDRDQIDRVIEGSMKNNAVAAVVVHLADRDNTVQARARDARWKVGPMNRDFRPDDLRRESREISAGSEHVGHLDLYVTAKFIEEGLAGYRALLVARVLGTDAIIVLALYLLLWRLILKPLQEMELFAADVSAGKGRSAALAGRRFRGELESLRRSMENTIGLLDSRYAALEKSEQELRASEARVRALGDNLPNGVVYQLQREPDGTRRFLHISAGVRRLNGLFADAVLRDPTLLYAQIAPADRAKLVQAEEESLATMNVFNAIVQLRRTDGAVRWMHLCSAPRRLPDGLVLWDGIETDITEQREAAAAQEETYDRLVLALKVGRLGTFRRNLRADTSVWDQQMYLICGIPPTAPVPSHDEFIAMIHPADRTKVNTSIRTASHGRHELSHSFRFIRRDGVVRHFVVHSLVEPGEDGKAMWHTGVFNDISDVVQATAETERLREQLVQAKKMETLGTLAAGIAHDFNNLLTGINGFVEMAATSLPANHEAADMLVQARRGAMNARDLVRRILTYSRRSQDSKRAPVSLGDLVRDSAPLISNVLPANVTLAVDVPSSVPVVLADPGQIQQVLMNLSQNGAHAIGPNPGTLRIGIRALAFAGGAENPPPAGCEPGPYVCLQVSDTGCGMDEATLARIFEPFYTTKKTGEGTGLGLSIVQDIVTAHEGTIQVTSAPGRGTTFALYFPVASTAPGLATKSTASSPAQQGAGQVILVVDDERSVAGVVNLALRRHGYAPQVFTSSEEAWSHFSRNPQQFNLLMIDHQMPTLDGAEFVRRARGMAPALPIILMSGRLSQTGASAHPFEPGITSMKKPFEIAEMLQLVKRLLNA